MRCVKRRLATPVRRLPVRRKRPLTIGLTGSIAMGKSTVATMFRAAGVPVFDADAAVHGLQGRGGDAVAAIEAAFPGTTSADGVDRRRLGAQVLGDPAALKRLESLLHPAVARLQRQFLRCHVAQPLVVLDIPLLFEKGGAGRVNITAVVTAAAWQQRRRAMARPGMTAARLRAVRALQMPDSAKRQRADILIPTGGTIAATRASVRRFLSCLRRRRGAL